MHCGTRWLVLCGLCTGLLALTNMPVLGAPSAFFVQSWEEGIGDWSASNGVWEAGLPTQITAFRGNRCAATGLATNYPYAASSRLTSPLIVLPATPTDGTLTLGFWHWFNNANSDGADYGEAQVWTSAGGWQPASRRFYMYSAVWTPYYVDLSAYAGQTIRLGFLFQDIDQGQWSGHVEGPGWFVDEVKVCEGAFDAMAMPSSFEHRDIMDWSGWYAEQGVWEIGQPSNGPSAAYSGRRCAGTVMSGSYPYGTASRLVGPRTQLPTSPRDGKLWLSFKQWCSVSWGDGQDYGVVEILDGTTWVALTSAFSPSSSAWSERVLDISAYAGDTVRFGFRLQDVDQGNWSGHSEAAGWFIDDVSVTDGRLYFDNPSDCENDTPGWSCEEGVWQIGSPSVGPSAAHSGSKCWGTRLAGNYPYGANDRLRSPFVTLPSAPPGVLELRLWHWFSFANSDGADYGSIYIQPEGGSEEQKASFTNTSGINWTQYSIDLLPYAGQTVRFIFLMRDVDNGNWSGTVESSGWYIDDIEIVGMDYSTPVGPFHLEEEINPGPAAISWIHNPIGMANVVLYGSPVRDFRPSIGTRLAILPADVFSYSDVNHLGWPGLYYGVSVVDALGHESMIRMPDWASAAPADDAPAGLPVSLRQAAPNPFNPITTIEFDVNRPSDVSLTVYDVRGRLVRTLWRGAVEPGLRKVAWDGRDEAGRDVSAGMYMVRLCSDGADPQTRKLTLAK